MAKKVMSAPRNKKEFLKKLYESDKYKNALSRARTDEERRALAGLASEFVAGFADILGPIIERASRDPVFAEQLGRAVVERQGVVTDSAPVTSGSTG